jgi:hypothetical protein
VRQAPELHVNLIEQLLHVRNPVVMWRRKIPVQIGKREMHSNQQLSRFVVQRVSDALDLKFQHFVQVAHCGDCLAEPSVCHLIGRQDFG